jgi:hypothetical protein
MTQPRTACPDCKTETITIKLIDRTGENPMHQELSYAVGEAERSWFLGKFPITGTVRARMGPAVGRIILHGLSA